MGVAGTDVAIDAGNLCHCSADDAGGEDEYRFYRHLQCGGSLPCGHRPLVTHLGGCGAVVARSGHPCQFSAVAARRLRAAGVIFLFNLVDWLIPSTLDNGGESGYSYLRKR